MGAIELREHRGTSSKPIEIPPKHRALLAYLALVRPRETFLPRDTLAGLFWPEHDQEHARSNLRKAVYELRRLIGPKTLLTRGKEEIGLDRDRFWCDAVELEESLAGDDPGSGLDLYRGELLPGMHLSDSAEFERWLEGERSAIGERVRSAIRRLADTAEAGGKLAEAARWHRRALVVDPYDESTLCKLMDVRARLGDRAGAVKAYEAFARRLIEDLDLEPTQETREMAEAVRTAEADEPVVSAGSSRMSAAGEAGAKGSAPVTVHTVEHRVVERSVALPPTWPRLLRVALVYAAVAFLVVLMVSTTVDAYNQPLWIIQATILAAVLGLPITLALARVLGLKPGTARSASWRALGRRDVATASIVIVLTLATGWGVWNRWSFLPPASTSPGVAVLPFTAGRADLDIWREGMVDLLTLGLGNAGEVRAVTSRTVLAGWQRKVGSENSADLATALDVARSVGGQYAVVGAVVGIGKRMRFTVDVYDVDSGKHLGRSQVDSVPDSVLMVADKLTVDILRLVYERAKDLPKADLAQITSSDPEAIKAYLLGMVRFRHGDFADAVEAYERAIEADSTFAEAHFELYKLRSMWDYRVQDFTLARFHRDQALRFSDRLSVRTHIFARAARDWGQGTLDGFEPLREWVRLHPDDSRAWSVLANSYRNLPGTLASAEQMEEAWTRAMELDSLDLTPRAYLMELTWEVLTDSARSVQMFESINRLAPEQAAEYGASGSTFLALAFGDSATRERTIAGLDTIVSPKNRRLPHHLLAHPRWAELAETVFLAFDRNGVETHLGPFEGMALFHLNANWRGKVRRGLPYLEGYDSGEWELPDFVVAWYVWNLAYLPRLPMAEAYEQIFGTIDIESAERDRMVTYAGIYAADQARWDDHARAVAEQRRRTQKNLEVGDTLSARLTAATVRLMEAYATWRRGDPAAAVAAVEDVLQFRALSVRWYLGELYMELERWEDAERVYRSLGFDYLGRLGVWPVSHYKLGKIYEKLEEREKAVASYEYFVKHWKNADPELQPMVEEARQAVRRLRGSRRG